MCHSSRPRLLPVRRLRNGTPVDPHLAGFAGIVSSDLLRLSQPAKTGDLQMPTSALPVSLPDDPALLRIDGPIATLTLNRPAAFNSIDLSIARKLEQLSAAIEASDTVRVLVIEGEGHAFCAGGDLQTIGAAAAADTVAPVVGELLKHYHAFITSLRRMPKIVLTSVHGSQRVPDCRSPLSRTFASPPMMPASRRPMQARVSPDGGARSA